MTAFDQFWTRYPRRVARKDAQKAWAQVNGDDAIDAILDALAWQTTQAAWTKDDGAFVPYPAFRTHRPNIRQLQIKSFYGKEVAVEREHQARDAHQGCRTVPCLSRHGEGWG